MHETRSTMRRSFSLRSHFALLIALLVTLLSWLLGSLIGNDASQRIREEVGRDLVEASLQMIDRLDSDMAGRAAYLQVLASLQVLRQPDDSGQIRALLDRIHQQIPSVAWIGFTDPNGQVVASSGGVLPVRNQKIRLAMPFPENREPFGETLSSGASHDVADKENPHRIRKRYFAYSVARVSLLTVTLICPGYFISSSIFRAMSNASLCTSPSSVIFGETTTRTSRPA